MTRAPLAWPHARPADADAGGAADLQTDVMRFMAILALCLVAIFALVQSLPMAPAPPPATAAASGTEVSTRPAAPPERTAAVTRPPPDPAVQPAAQALPEPGTSAAAKPAARPAGELVVLTRTAPRLPDPAPANAPNAQEPERAPPASPPADVAEPAGFTLAFESDLALMRLVAAGRVGLYALDGSRAWRMAVSNSRISFWDASMPNEFHEMEAATVPAPVIDALRQSGAGDAGIAWGVTLPAATRRELDAMLGAGQGGDLKIRADGSIVKGDSR